MLKYFLCGKKNFSIKERSATHLDFKCCQFVEPTGIVRSILYSPKYKALFLFCLVLGIVNNWQNTTIIRYATRVCWKVLYIQVYIHITLYIYIYICNIYYVYVCIFGPLHWFVTIYYTRLLWLTKYLFINKDIWDIDIILTKTLKTLIF